MKPSSLRALHQSEKCLNISRAHMMTSLAKNVPGYRPTTLSKKDFITGGLFYCNNIWCYPNVLMVFSKILFKIFIGN